MCGEEMASASRSYEKEAQEAPRVIERLGGLEMQRLLEEGCG